MAGVSTTGTQRKMKQIVIFVVFLQVLFLSTSNAAPAYSNQGEFEVCKTQVCNYTARIMKSAMDTKVNPCDDFYKFACGNFLRTNQHKASKENPYIGPFYEAGSRRDRNLRGLLDKYDLKADAVDAMSNTVRLYRSCRKSVSHGPANIAFLKGMLGDFLGGWPMSDSSAWNDKNFDLGTFFGKLSRQLDDSFYLSAKVVPDIAKASQYTLLVTAEDPFQSLSHHSNPSKKKKKKKKKQQKKKKQSYSIPKTDLETTIRKAVCVMDPACKKNPHLSRDIKELADNLRKIEKANITLPRPLSKDKDVLDFYPAKDTSYRVKDDNKFSIKELSERIPEVNWENYFKYLFADTKYVPGKDFEVSCSIDTIRSMLSTHVTNLGSKRAKANFFGWNLVTKWGPTFSSKLRNILKPDHNQGDICLEVVDQSMGYALARIYNDQYVDQKAIKEVYQIVGDLKEGFKELLKENSWIDSTTKAHAIEKIDNMVKSVAEPTWIRNDTRLNAYYAQATFDDNSHFRENLKKVRIAKFTNAVNRIGKKVDRVNEWPIDTPSMTNAFYSPMSNTMYFGSGMLQFPFYVHGRPSAVNMGSIGYIAGHEMTHGFDTNGRTRNKRGEIEDWWSQSSLNQFDIREECFIKQYSKIVEPSTKQKLNGQKTVAEDIADNGAVRQAYKTFQSISKMKGGRLSGLEQYTENQLFFLSAGLTYCAVTHPEGMKTQIATDNHSAHMFRVVVPFQNSDSFSAAFSCPKKKFMNPDNKCRIW